MDIKDHFMHTKEGISIINMKFFFF